MLFTECYFLCSCFNLFLESRTSSTHPQFATAYFLSWMPCYRCKQRITIIGLQTYSNILIEGILLKMLRNKRELYLEQAIWFYFVWPVHFALLTQTQLQLRAEQENFWTFRRSICLLNYCALDIKSINRKSFVAWSCFCHTEKIKLVHSDRCLFFIFFMTAFYLV